MVFTVLVSIYECSDFPDANKTNLRQTDSIYPYGKNTANREKQKKKAPSAGGRVTFRLLRDHGTELPLHAIRRT